MAVPNPIQNNVSTPSASEVTQANEWKSMSNQVLDFKYGQSTPSPAMPSDAPVLPERIGVPGAFGGNVVGQPQSPQQMDAYLNNVQNSTYKALGQSGMDLESFEKKVEAMKSSPEYKMSSIERSISAGDAPELPSLVDTFNEYRNVYGVGDLESGLNGLKTRRRDVEARLRARRNMERGKAVGLNVISGRVSEVEMQERENMEFLDRQIQTYNDQLQSAYGLIDTITNLTDKDYQNASADYDRRYRQKVQAYELLVDQTRDERDFGEQQRQFNAKIAQANLNIYVDLVSSGQMSWDKMGSDQRLEVQKLSMKAGFPKDFFQNLKMKPGANVLSTTKRTAPNGDAYADMIYIDSNGQTKVQSVKLGKEYRASSGSSSYSKQMSDIQKRIEERFDSLLSDNDPYKKEVKQAPFGRDEGGKPTQSVTVSPGDVVNGKRYSFTP